jgi:hypothetical protein
MNRPIAALTALALRRVRGFRVLDIAAAVCLTLIVLVVYMSKAGAGAEGAKIADTTRQIAAEEQKVRLLRAEHAYLTQPERLRRLSETYLQMGPVKPTHEATPETLTPQALTQVRQTAPVTPTLAPAQPVEVVR